MNNIPASVNSATQHHSVIDLYLQKQQQLSAVDLFSQSHDTNLPLANALDDSSLYHDLIPISTPDHHQQYAFEVDLDQCSGCKACVTACHSLNGLEPEETWRSVGMIHGNTEKISEHVYQRDASLLQTVTTACHHCLEPACLIGCPVNAYDKDPITGIVKHLDDQCIGCQYCTLTCPYGVPKYSEQLGIVRKCDMCSNRLAAREQPACVQGCPNGAISIRLVDIQEIQNKPNAQVNIPGAPDSHHTLPTTRYVTRQKIAEHWKALDQYLVKAEHAHLPLVIMLVLTQLSVGGFLVSILQNHLSGLRELSVFPLLHTTLALSLGLTGLVASVFHLGRPLYAFRAVLGWKQSWMSREVLSLGLFAKLAIVYTLLSWLPVYQSWLPMSVLSSLSPLLQHGLGAMVGMIGAIGIFCSAMIYQSTPRLWWSTTDTTVKFFLTALILGTALAAFTLTGSVLLGSQQIGSAQQQLILSFYLILIAATTLKLVIEFYRLQQASSEKLTTLWKTAQLLFGQLKYVTFSRLVLGIVGGILLPFVMVINPGMSLSFLLAGSMGIFMCTLGGEFLERYLFFTAALPDKMPGIQE